MTSPQVVIVDETFAITFFPNDDPIGKRIRPGVSAEDLQPWREIGGVVAKAKLVGMAEDFQPQFYISYVQLPGRWPSIVVRTKIAFPWGVLPPPAIFELASTAFAGPFKYAMSPAPQFLQRSRAKRAATCPAHFTSFPRRRRWSLPSDPAPRRWRSEVYRLHAHGKAPPPPLLAQALQHHRADTMYTSNSRLSGLLPIL